MEAFSWLLISDLHLKADSGTWGQSVVLRDMVRDMEARKEDLQNIQFIIVSGDLAFSGSQAEYLLVEAFLDDLRTVVGLDRSRVFFVPGNHDISRGIQTTCYSGARDLLNSPQALEQFLATPLERDTLLQRLSAFIDFDMTKVTGVAMRRSEGSSPEWVGCCGGADDRGVRGRCRARHRLSRPSETMPLPCNSPSSRRIASRCVPSKATSSRTINSLVVRPRGNASIVFSKSDMEYFARKYATTPGGPPMDYCPLLSSRQQSSNVRNGCVWTVAHVMSALPTRD